MELLPAAEAEAVEAALLLRGPVHVVDRGVLGFTSKLPSLFELLFLGEEPPLRL